jgi:hypothetical protein
MISSRSALVIAAFAMALVAGCGGATVTRTTNTASVGKELEDLKKAYDSGAINQQEYDRARNKILNQRN